MSKIYLSGNYLIAETGGVTYEFAMSNTIYTKKTDRFEVLEHNGGTLIIKDADISSWTDLGGTPFTTGTLTTFLRANTGATPGGGGGGGDSSAANQVLEIAELTDINTALDQDVSEETAFVTTALLADAATFASGVLDATGKTQVQTEISASHDGTIDISFYSDAGGTDLVRSLSIPYVAANGYQFFSAPAFVNFVKYEFTNNGGVTQTDFYYTTKLLTTGLSPQLLTTGAFIAPAMVAHLSRSILTGKNDAGNFNNVPLDNQNHLEVNVSNPKTSYDELMVANLSPVSQITFPYNINTDIVDVTEVAGGTVTQADNMAVLNTSATTASSAILTSIEQVPYRAGQGHIARFACLFIGTPTVATAYTGIGVGDASDGYGFLLNNLGFNIAYRTNASQTSILQSNWNVDKMDGSKDSNNPSGMNLDITKGNSYQISYGSGFGTVNFSIESDISGDYVLVHVLALANTLTVPSTYNPTFPIRAESANGSGTDNLTILVDSLSSFIEGENAIQYSQGVLNSQSGVENGNFATEVELITFFNKSDVFGGTGNNKVYCKILGISWLNDCNKTATVRIREEATGMSAGTFTDIDSDTSVVSYRTDATGTITGGKVLFEAFAEKDGKGGIFVNLKDLGLIMTPSKKYTISAVCLVSAATDNQFATLLFQEDF